LHNTRNISNYIENHAKKAEPNISGRMVTAFTESAKHELRLFEEAVKQQIKYGSFSETMQMVSGMPDERIF
jgi:hypothetical protein